PLSRSQPPIMDRRYVRSGRRLAAAEKTARSISSPSRSDGEGDREAVEGLPDAAPPRFLPIAPRWGGGGSPEAIRRRDHTKPQAKHGGGVTAPHCPPPEGPPLHKPGRAPPAMCGLTSR